MFTKPINEIEYEDVKNCCDEQGEGFHVEYKRDVKDYKKHIPKIVSSFANYQGGTLIIGVECDRKMNEVKSIDGIPSRNDIEEQVRNIALTKIYPPIMPAVRIVGMPNSDNVLVVVHVDESVQAPHTIINKTHVYIRSGNISHPYKLADIDMIEYMFKRRTDSQVVAKRILDRIEERASYLLKRRYPPPPFLTVSIQPIFPYRPIISPSTTYRLHTPQTYPPRRVNGGVCYFQDHECFEFNEYGIVSRSTILSVPGESKGQIRFGDLLYDINYFLEDARKFYQNCEYLGNIEFKMQLQNVNRCTMDDLTYNGINIVNYTQYGLQSSDQEVIAGQQCLVRDIEDRVKRIDLVLELIGKILWSFEVPIDDQRVCDLIRKRIDNYVK